MTYTCICGRCFDHLQAFNGHKSHCIMHQQQKYGNLDIFQHARELRIAGNIQTKLTKKAKRLEELDADKISWLNEHHICEHCGSVITSYLGTGRFCSRSCANSRPQSKKSKEKISKSVSITMKRLGSSIKQSNIKKYLENPNLCVVCNSILPYEIKHRKTCSNACLHTLMCKAGQRSSTITCNRSKNEISFYLLCENRFGVGSVLHNTPMFNGWDADIIIPQYKLAILWNGLWHYEKLAKRHSVEQVQTRDKLKIESIKQCGYIPYVIVDLGSYNENKVEEEFNKLLNYISNYIEV